MEIFGVDKDSSRYQQLNYNDAYIEYELYQLINKRILDWVIVEEVEGKDFGCVFKTYSVLED